MKKRGGRFLLILGAGLAAMAFIVVYIATSKGLGNSQAASVPTVVPLTTMAVINQDVPAYTVLDAANVATIDVEASTAVSPTTSDSPWTKKRPPGQGWGFGGFFDGALGTSRLSAAAVAASAMSNRGRTLTPFSTFRRPRR